MIEREKQHVRLNMFFNDKETTSVNYLRCYGDGDVSEEPQCSVIRSAVDV